MTRTASRSNRPTVRCAIYTRKSTEEGLDQEFNSLDAQRESGEAYVASMKAEGWTCLPQRYDDGGFTGANIDRPALQKLLADIADRRVDTVVVYKVDRLSRSLLDFARLMELFDKHGVTFVSVTQQFNTTHSMGRLTLNILLSFAQFEREIISERTRDKIAAARKKGKYIGGRPVLGYDLQHSPSRLVVNEPEAEQVRTIFEIYLEKRSIPQTVKELDRRGWTTKQWTTKNGKLLGGRPFDRNGLYNLLTNVVYVGKVRHQDQLYDGEHTAIVAADLFQKVQATLRENYARGGSRTQNRYGALLKGLLRCAPCGCGMMHAYSVRHNNRYRYYVCCRAQKRGWHTCPSKSVPAAEIETLVLDQIRKLGPEQLQPVVDGPAQQVTIAENTPAAFDSRWAGLSSPEKVRVLRHFVRKVEYDGSTGTVSIFLCPNGTDQEQDRNLVYCPPHLCGCRGSPG
jgi:site-specific DNA recombinase